MLSAGDKPVPVASPALHVVAEFLVGDDLLNPRKECILVLGDEER